MAYERRRACHQSCQPVLWKAPDAGRQSQVGSDWEDVQRYDSDGSGQLDDDEMQEIKDWVAREREAAEAAALKDATAVTDMDYENDKKSGVSFNNCSDSRGSHKEIWLVLTRAFAGYRCKSRHGDGAAKWWGHVVGHGGEDTQYRKQRDGHQRGTASALH